MSNDRNWLAGVAVLVAGVCTAMPYYRKATAPSEPDFPRAAESERGSQIPLRLEPLPLVNADQLIAPLREQTRQESERAWSLRNEQALEDLAPQARFTPPPALQASYPTGIVDPAPRRVPAADLSERPRAPDADRFGADGSSRPVDRAAWNTQDSGRHVVQPSSAAEPYFDTHVVRDGETLESIAALRLGDPQRAREIFHANRHLMDHPQLVPVGARLRIPR